MKKLIICWLHLMDEWRQKIDGENGEFSSGILKFVRRTKNYHEINLFHHFTNSGARF